MATILLGEEFGASWAGAHVLGSLGRALAAAGHACVYALRDLTEAQLLGAGAHRVVQAPVWRGPAFYKVDQIGRSKARIGGVADMLAIHGLADDGVVERTVSAWRRLLEMIRPDAVIGHFSPALMLAAAAAGLPRILAGEGWAMPPPVAGGLPRHDTLQPPVVRDRDIMEAVDAVRGRLGLPRSEGLAGVLEADARMVFCHPAFDIHALVRKEAVLGPLAPPPPSNGTRSGVVALLSITQGEIEDVVFGLLASGAPMRIHVRGASPAMQYYLDNAGAAVGLLEALEAIPSSRLLVHQGDAEPAQIAALAGTPQLLLPQGTAESRFIAGRVVDLGVGAIVAVARKPTSAMEQAVKAAYGDGDLAAHCRRRAVELAVAGPFAGASAVVGEVARLLPRSAA